MYLGTFSQLDDSMRKYVACCGMIGAGRLGTITRVITGSSRASECRGQGTRMENRTEMEIDLSALLCFFCLYSVCISRVFHIRVYEYYLDCMDGTDPASPHKHIQNEALTM